MIEDENEPVVEVETVSDADLSAAELDDDVIVEFEGVSDIVTSATAEGEDSAIVEFELVDDTDTDVTAEDEIEPVVELKPVSVAEEELEVVSKTAFARRLPSVELLELYVDVMLEELEIGRLDNEDETDRVLLDKIDVELLALFEDDEGLATLLEDDFGVERTLLDEVDEFMLDFEILLLVEDAKLRLEDGVAEVDRIFGVELDRDRVDDRETEELLVVLLLLLLVLVELLLLLLDVLVLFLLVLILVSDALNELDVVDVTSLVTLLQTVNRFA